MPGDEEKVDWVRGPRKADVSGVGVHKLQKAHEERGINVEVDADRPGQFEITKTVIAEMPAPKLQKSSK